MCSCIAHGAADRLDDNSSCWQLHLGLTSQSVLMVLCWDITAFAVLAVHCGSANMQSLHIVCHARSMCTVIGMRSEKLGTQDTLWMVRSVLEPGTSVLVFHLVVALLMSISFDQPFHGQRLACNAGLSMCAHV